MKHILLTSMILSLSTVSVANDTASSKSQIGNSYTGNPADSAPAQPDSQREMKPVSYSFPINDINQLDFSQKQAHVQSRQYMLDVSGAQLKSGIALNTSAKGALVRISAFDGKSAVEPQQLSLKTPKGQVLKQGKAFDTLVSSSAMQKNGMGFQQGTTGFKLDDTLGAGRFTLKADKGIASHAKYRINVFEKNSDTEMHLTANKSNYLSGEVLKVDARVFNQGKAEHIVSIKGRLVSPTGKTFDIDFNQSKDGYSVAKPLDMSAHSVPGALWELHTEAQLKVDGQLIQRNGQLPFAFAQQTAKVSSSPVITGQKQSPVAAIPVNAKTDGRYEVRAVLYGTDQSGALKPVMVTHSAANLAAGEGAIYMKFDPELIHQSGVSAPYTLKQLQLRDQGQMAVMSH
ncbi:DUF4785 domain-containing protein [Kangiella taiwanensis]|uniref:DUF4785 family protein n=1 Tax=Kangiella taiwanensis TaxID=1079179 RepID=A0ABP8I1U6_9GAMM|nr:DUF4785 domain-containing protein [Kangiella taiwanensis]